MLSVDGEKTSGSGQRSRRFPGRAARVLLALAGVAVIAVIFRAVGWSAVEKNLAVIGGWFVLLVLLYALAQLAFALGWWVVIDPRPRASAFAGVFAIYLAGDSLNYLAANVGGEPVKAHLLGDRVGTGNAIVSIAVHKHADLAAQFAFAAAGVTVALAQFSFPLGIRIAAAAGVAVLGGLLLFMTLALRKGSFSPLLERLSRWRLFARLARHRAAAGAVDARILEYYGRRKRQFLFAMGWCLLGWCGGLLETYLIVRLLIPSRGFGTSFAIEALAMVLNNMLIFVPGRIGSAEGVRALVFVLVGLPLAKGVAYGLVRRGRELLWLLPGLLVLLARHAGRLGRPDAPDIKSAWDRDSRQKVG
jgi:Lysylphosphatidylglycerol synthase TM region